jgi:two-component system response regulator (stage 0 sporulation protein A)
MSILEKKVEAMMQLCVAENERDREKIREEIRYYLMQRHRDSVDPEQEIRRILLELGAPDHLVGHPYVIRAILLVISDRLYINSITFGLYPQLAVEFDTTPARVERAIRHLIEVTWARGDLDILEKYFGNTVSASRGKPTNGEFIARMANVVKANVQRAA